MYVMQDDSFSLISLRVMVLWDVESSDKFPICSEFCNHAFDTYKTLLGKPPLCFNSSILLRPHFDSLMGKILVNFSQYSGQ